MDCLQRATRLKRLTLGDAFQMGDLCFLYKAALCEYSLSLIWVSLNVIMNMYEGFKDNVLRSIFRFYPAFKGLIAMAMVQLILDHKLLNL